MHEFLRIGEAAEALGVSPKTLRFYEAKGVLPLTRRSGAGYRLYAPEDLERARLVLRLKAMGLDLDEAREVVACAEEACCGAMGPELEAILQSKVAAVEVQIRELTALRQRLDEALASVRVAAGRNRRGGECTEETCLPLEVKRRPVPAR